MATRKAPLRSVKPGEKAHRARQLSVTAAAAGGNRRELLVAMRARVATAVQDPNTPQRDLAALTRRLMEIAKDIEALDVAAEEGVGAEPHPDESFDASTL